MSFMSIPPELRERKMYERDLLAAVKRLFNKTPGMTNFELHRLAAKEATAKANKRHAKSRYKGYKARKRLRKRIRKATQGGAGSTVEAVTETARAQRTDESSQSSTALAPPLRIPETYGTIEP